MNSLNFSNLECFFTLSQNLSFSKTSTELKISQSAVSKRIRALEEEIQAQLFIRTKHEVYLSAKGQSFLESIRPVFMELRQRINEFQNEEYEFQGKIRFACFQEIGEKVFVPLMNSFKKKYPKIQFDIKFLKTDEIISGVKNGNYDLGVVSDSILLESIRSYHLGDEEIALVTSKKNSTNKIVDLSRLPFVNYRENHNLLGKYLKQIFPKLKLDQLKIEFSVSSHRSMAELVHEHHYYAVLPLLSVKSEIQSGKLVNVGQKNFKSPLYLIHADSDYLDIKVKELKKYILNHGKSCLE